jgi:hypothetical protein
MFARSQWTPPTDRRVRADAQDVLEASGALLRRFEDRRATYHQWESDALALLSELNRDVPVPPKGANRAD